MNFDPGIKFIVYETVNFPQTVLKVLNVRLRPWETGKFLLRLIKMIVEILTIITKRLIAIIIISFVNH